MSLAVAGARHLQALLGSLGRLARSPLSTILTLLVIALALALPTSLRLLVANAQLATGNFANAVDVSVYLKTDVPLAKAQQLAQAAGQRADVAAVTVIPADKGLEDSAPTRIRGGAAGAQGESAAARAARTAQGRGCFRRSARVAAPLLKRLARGGTGAGGLRMGHALQRHSRGVAAAAADRRGAARPGSARGHRQHHPSRDPGAPCGNRSHQTRGRIQLLRAPAVPVHRRALWSRRRAARVGDRRDRRRSARGLGGDARQALRQPLRAARPVAR